MESPGGFQRGEIFDSLSRLIRWMAGGIAVSPPDRIAALSGSFLRQRRKKKL
jgi:hypothetical protein